MSRAGPRPERSGPVGLFVGPPAQGLSRCWEGQRGGGLALTLGLLTLDVVAAAAQTLLLRLTCWTEALGLVLGGC